MNNKVPKIGILTYHFADNFGAVFQAYALQQLLSSLGYESEFIDYQPAHVQKGGSFVLPISKNRIKANVVTAYQKLTTLRQMLFDDGSRQKKFLDFRRQHLTVGSRRFATLEELQNSEHGYDHLICGSDQIWNSSIQYGIDPAYFLNFGNPQTNRISFAPSFGNGTVDTQHQKQVAGLLSSIDHLSVRETSGVELVKRLAGREAICVPDPTLMIDDFSAIVTDHEQRDYIMSYVLRSADTVTDVQRLVADTLNLPMLVPKDRYLKKQNLGTSIDPTPGQWLGYIRDANFVVTNSFHGTAFSVIFQKPFISVGITGRKSGVNDRAKSFLTRLGLQDRFIERFDPDVIRERIKTDIDWSSVSDRTHQWRQETINFLQTSLN